MGDPAPVTYARVALSADSTSQPGLGGGFIFHPPSLNFNPNRLEVCEPSAYTFTVSRGGSKMTHNKLTTFILLETVVLFAGCESNQPPNVQVGSNQTVNVGDRVRLRGSASDPDGAIGRTGKTTGLPVCCVCLCVWGLRASRDAWWFVAQHTEVHAFCGSPLQFHREPVPCYRFSSCPVFLVPDPTYREQRPSRERPESRSP